MHNCSIYPQIFSPSWWLLSPKTVNTFWDEFTVFVRIFKLKKILKTAKFSLFKMQMLKIKSGIKRKLFLLAHFSFYLSVVLLLLVWLVFGSTGV
jgi:hypothetical protein